MGNVAPGPADVVKLSLGQPGQFAPHLGSVAPRMEDFADLAQRPSEQANSMMICHQENCFAHDGSLLTDAEAGLVRAPQCVSAAASVLSAAAIMLDA